MNTHANNFLAVADGLGARLGRDAIWHGPRCNWTGDSMEFLSGQWQVAHRALGPELYSGTSGVALFLARLFEATREPLFGTVARAALEQAASQVDALAPATRGGFYSGAIGIAWALVRAGTLLDAPSAVERGWSLLASTRDDDLSAQGLDVTSGSAGSILALIDLAAHATEASTREQTLALACRHGRRLIDSAQRGERGWSWSGMPGAQPQGLCGFSHGAAGPAWALLALHHSTNVAEFRLASEQAVRYERSWFNPDEQNWPDLRSLYDPTLGDGKRLTYMSAWCHGAPGIGLARLASYAVTNQPEYLEEVRAAVRTTTAGLRLALQAGQGNFSLCHGLAGNADLLLEAAKVLHEPEHATLAMQIGHLGEALYARTGAPWPCGVVGGGETPSLMLGLSGIGHFYLRLHDALIPSVLLVANQAR